MNILVMYVKKVCKYSRSGRRSTKKQKNIDYGLNCKIKKPRTPMKYLLETMEQNNFLDIHLTRSSKVTFCPSVLLNNALTD